MALSRNPHLPFSISFVKLGSSCRLIASSLGTRSTHKYFHPFCTVEGAASFRVKNVDTPDCCITKRSI